MSNIDNALPVYDKTAIKDPAIFFRTLFHLNEIKEERAIPAIVKSYDAKNGIVTVIPMTKYVFNTKQGQESLDRDSISVPIIRICHGGFSVSMPVFVGDTGWLIAGDRKCGRAVKKNNEILVRDLTEREMENRTEVPDDFSILNFENGFFLPFSWNVEEQKINSAGNFVIRNIRNKIYDKDIDNVFGVVRDDNGNDVPFITDPDGHTHSLDGLFHGKYAWSLIEIQKDGSVNIHGQGKRLSIRENGLFLDDRPIGITGNVEGSERIFGDIKAFGVKGSGLNVFTAKNEMQFDIADRPSDSDMSAKKMEVFDKDGNAIGMLHFYSDNHLRLKPGVGIDIAVDDDGSYRIVNDGIIGLVAGSNITIEEAKDEHGNVRKGWFVISSVGGGGGSVLVDRKSIKFIDGESDDIIELYGFRNQDNFEGTIADTLLGDVDKADEYGSVVRTKKNGEIQYIPIGKFADIELEVVTGIPRIEVTDAGLTLYYTKARIRPLTSVGLNMAEIEIPTETVDMVSKSEYNARGDYTFTNKVRTLRVIKVSEEKYAANTVFETTPHDTSH